MKIYVVCHEELGEYIGHGLYHDNIVQDYYFIDCESADKKAKELGDEYYVDEIDVEE